MRAHASIVGPIDTGERPMWIGLTFAETGEAVAHAPAPGPAEACRALGQQLASGQFSEITCDSELADLAADHGWRPAEPPEAAAEGKAMFAVSMLHGPGMMSLSPLVWREVLLAAAALWEAKPWEVSGELPFEIEIAGESTPRIAILMGILGEHFGLLIFEDEAAFDRFQALDTEKDPDAVVTIPQLWLAFESESNWAASAVAEFVPLPGCPTICSVQGGEADMPTPQEAAILLATVRLLLRAGAETGRVVESYELPGTDTTVTVATTAPEISTDEQEELDGSPVEVPDYGLDSSELERLHEFLLDNRRPAGTIWIDQLHGFLTAIVTGPRTIPPNEWLPAILPDDPGFASETEAHEILGLLMRFYNGIIYEMEHADHFVPMIFESEPDELPGEREWCAAYLQGAAMHGDVWLTNRDERLRELLTPIIVLGVEEPTPEIEAELSDPERVEELRRMIPDCARGLYRYWLQQRMPPETHAAADKPKVGRNEPCPCGSGKKYKKCCGSKN